MLRAYQNLKWLILSILSLLLLACGDGDYDGLDNEVTFATPNKFLTFFNSQQGGLAETGYATAYYAAVDPGNNRDTLQKFLSLHGFDNPGADQHAIFRDSKDLGYGRDMYMRTYPSTECGGQQVTVFYVRNFSVNIVDGFAYGPVNLEAAIADDQQYHFGSNAIEFSRGLTSAGDTCSPEPMAKFYTYRSDYSSPGAPHPRLLSVNLDGRGEKAMPQPCITCHGGKLRPLDRFGRIVALHANDTASQIGDTKSRLQAFEVDTFEFSADSGYTRADFEEVLREMNSAIYCSYPDSAGHAACTDYGNGTAAATDAGEWSGDFAREMLLGWYGNALETTNSIFDDSFIPAGWVPSIGGPPGGADVLFQKVIGPNCFVCHGKQGTELSASSNLANDGKDVDFSSWAKFISYADDIKRLVYDQGRMPLGLLNYDNFWNDPEKAELLGSFITPYVSNFAADHVDTNGDIIPPGRILANAGPDRVTLPNASITLDAGASLFTDSYEWSLVSSPIGSTASISLAGAAKTDFVADTDGNYLLRLTARSSLDNTSVTDDLNIVVDIGLAVAPGSLTFYANIEPFLAVNCTGCHSSGSVAGMPVWWTADATQPLGIPATVTDTSSLGLYEQVMARVNQDDLENSLLLRNPSGNHHNGGLLTGFDTTQTIGSAGRFNYDLFVNWIAEGAVCGGSISQCP